MFDLSIVIIGKNESIHLKRSLSRLASIRENLYNYDLQIIYIDSNSSDNSIDIALSFIDIDVYQIKGDINAAVARNVGGNLAMSHNLLFVDGDMEIHPEFIEECLSEDNKDILIASGHLVDYLYDGKGEFIKSTPRTFKDIRQEVRKKITVVGGLMFVRKFVWEQLGGMKPKYKRSQDYDFCLRANQLGIEITMLPVVAANHHTISFTHKDRMWKNVFGAYYFYPAILLRENVWNTRFLRKSLRQNWGGVILLINLLGIISGLIRPELGLGFYLFINSIYLLREAKNNHSTKKLLHILNLAINKLAVDISFVAGMLFFYPSNDKKYSIETKRQGYHSLIASNVDSSNYLNARRS